MAIGSMTTNSTVDIIDKTLTVSGAPADAAATGAAIAKCKADTLLAAYPVGSLYISSGPTSPASFIGGTWEQVKDRFILAAGDIYAAGSTGGEAEHTLDADEMPSHSHFLAKYYKISDNPGPGLIKATGNTAYQGENDITSGYYYTSITTSTGGSQPHNNLPPYLTAYIWKRIA